MTEFKADDLGYSIHWTYAVEYSLMAKGSNQVLYKQAYQPAMKKTGKFGFVADIAPVIHELVLNGYDLFIKDVKVRQLLDVPSDSDEKK